MEKSWQSKCSSPWHSTTQVPQQRGSQNQVEMNANNYFHPYVRQELRSSENGFVRDPMFDTSTSGSCRSGKPELGNSFLALLSGPSPHLQSGTQQVSSSRSSITSGKHPMHNSSIIFNGESCGLPVASVGLLSQHQVNSNMRNGIEQCSAAPSRAASISICSRASSLHDIQMADLTHGTNINKPALCPLVQGNETGPGASSPQWGWLVGSGSAASGPHNTSNIQASKKAPSTTGSTLPEPTSTFTRGCLRVFCLATGGDLLISNTGLIGVVCSCHGLQMSIAKFCEHSGLCAINPGNAVLLESGETVAQWRRLYFHKSGIRIPDDNSGWDWPDDFPATGVLVNTTMQSTSMKSSMFQLTDPSVALARSGDHCNNLGSLRNCNVGVNMLEKAFNAQQRSAPEGFNVHSTTAGGILHPQLDDQRMKTVVENSISNGLALSRSPLENSGDDSCYQSITDYIDFLTKGGNPLISNQSLGKLNFHSTDSDFNRRNSSREALIMEKSATSSNIELRLGQPSQPGHTLDTSVVPAMQPQPFSVIGNCLKSQLQDPIFHNLVNPRVAEEPRQNLRHVLSDTSSSRRPNMNQLNFTHLASRGCNITESPKVEHFKADVLRSAQISTVLSHLVTSETNIQSRAHSNMANYNKSLMSRVLHGESHSTNGLSSFPRSRTVRMELNINELDHLNNVDKGKGTENFADNDSLSKANSLFHNKQMADRIPLTGVVNGNSLPSTRTAHEKQCFYRFQSPGTPAVVSGVSNLSSQFDNTTSPGSSTYLDHALLRSTNSSIVTAGLGFLSPTVSTSFSSSSPIWRPNAMPNLSNKETIGLNPQFLDENLRLLALKHMVDLSKHEHSKGYRGANQDSNSYREINQEQQRVYSPTPIEVQRTGSSLDPLSCQQQNERSYRTTLQDAPTTQQHQTFSYCYMDRATEKSADVAGVNNWCNDSVPSQGISFRAKEHYLHCPPSHDLRTDRQPLPRIGRIENKITASCEHETGSKEEPRSYPGKCSCAVHSVHLAENCVTGGQGHIDDCKAHVGSNADCTELQGSVFDDGSVVQGDKTVALGYCQNMKRQLPKQNDCHASQWRDVPSKKSGVCNALSTERPVSVFDVRANTTDQYVQTTPKQLNGSQEAESLNEQQMSNVCSGISAPAVTEVMAEVNNMDSCTVETGGARYVRDNIIDEESGIQKCCSSDNALESERSTETVNASRKLDLIEGSSSSGIPMLPVHGSIDNHRIPNSHGLKKNVQGNIKSELRAGKKKKAIKWKSLDASFPVADLSSLARDCPSTRGTEFHPRLSRGTQTPRQPSRVLSKTLGSYSTQSAGLKRKRSALSSPKASLRKRNLHELDDHYRERVDDLHILSEDNINHPKVSKLSGEKKSKWHRTPDMSRLEQGQEANQVHAGKNAEHSSVGYVKNFFSNQAGTSDKKKRPVVCGKSGVISTGKSTEGRQKPAKIVSLSKILNTARRCSTFENEAKTCFRSDKCIDKPSASAEGRGDENYDSILENELKAGSSSSKMKKTYFNRKEICITELCMLNTEKDVGDKMLKDNILQKYSSAPLKSRFKEARKRSLSELEVKGKDLSSMKLRFKETSKLQTKFRSNGKPYEKQVSGSKCYGGEQSQVSSKKSVKERTCQAFVLDPDAFCGVCGSSNKDEINSLLECNSCSIRVHQACYGVSRVPRGRWCCRPCKANSKNIVCVLCGYGGGAMTRALRSQNIVKSLLKVWNVAKESNSRSYVPPCETSRNALKILESYSLGIEVTLVPGMMPIANQSPAAASIRISHNERDDTNGSVGDLEVNNTITAGVFDPTIKQWVHMVCGLWTPGTRCPNVDTMSTFDVSGASCPPKTVVCSLCNRPGGSRIQCRVVDCSVHFHPWCAHQKGLLQSEVEGVDNEKVGFYGRCMLHATYYGGDCDVHPMDNKLDTLGRGECTCARTEGYKGRKKDGFRRNIIQISGDNSGCLFPQEQINAWLHINGQRPCRRTFVKPLVSDVEYNYRMEYTRYKQAKGWKHLVVYKSGIHALGLYTSQYICRGAMVVEYVGEIVGLRVADKREVEYESGKKLPYKGACYFFRIDKEHIIDATRKGGIARFVNHSCLPNCVAKIISVRNEKKVVFFAERDINPGEEITYDYHFNNEDEGKKIPCFCNSKNCRRYLN